MSRSLKSIIPDLARVLGQTDAALYERQRALVREGLLEARPGHGRGSGVEATPYSVAMLLTGLLASIGLSDAGPRARDLADAVLHHDVTAGSVWKDPADWLPQYTRFIDALVHALADESFAKSQPTVRVGATDLTAYLEFKTHGKPHICAFVSRTSKDAYDSTNIGRPGLRIGVILDGVTFEAVSKIVVALLREDVQ